MVDRPVGTKERGVGFRRTFHKILALLIWGSVSEFNVQNTDFAYVFLVNKLAEREGFEPSVPRKRDNGFRVRKGPFRPAPFRSI